MAELPALRRSGSLLRGSPLRLRGSFLGTAQMRRNLLTASPSAVPRRGCLGVCITCEHFAPASQPVSQNDDVVQINAVYDKIGILRVVDAEQRSAERVLVETGVGALGESEQITFGVLAAG